MLSSIEKSRVHTSSNLIEDDNLKKEFIELQIMRNDVLSLRPKGMFNPKYHKVFNIKFMKYNHSLFKSILTKLGFIA